MGNRKKVNFIFQFYELYKKFWFYERVLKEVRGRGEVCGKEVEDVGKVFFDCIEDLEGKMGGFDCQGSRGRLGRGEKVQKKLEDKYKEKNQLINIYRVCIICQIFLQILECSNVGVYSLLGRVIDNNLV